MSDLGKLPRWRLSDLYSRVGDEAIASDMALCRARSRALAEKWKGKIDKADGDEIAGIIAEYEAIEEGVGRLSSYADLAFSTDTETPEVVRLMQTMLEFASEINSTLVFIELELARLDEKLLKNLLAKSEALKAWRSWLRVVRAYRPYQLSDDLETLLIEHKPSGRDAWVRLFDETATQLRFPIGKKEVTETEIMDMLLSADAKKRKEAGLSRAKVLAENSRLMALILNTIAKEKSVDDRWRGFKRPVSGRNLANDIDDEIVDNLAEAVNAAMPRLSHRYYKIKAKWMGGEQINWWDRNAPLPTQDTRQFTWQEAQEIILDSFGGFSPDMASLAKRFFDNDWIDAEPRPAKASGAFSHPTVPSAHPYILMNYSGQSQDVMTLAHELGHGIHQILAGEAQGYLKSQTPLTLAETASVFGEMLVFDKLIASASDDASRRTLLAQKIEDMLNTTIRQIAFYNFETAFHKKRQQGEVAVEEINDIWIETQTKALGEGVRIDENYRSLWGFIPHFIHSPFYVYAYAFGDCLVNALWQTSQEATDKEQFTKDYTELLKAGGTLRYDEALTPFGLDATSPKFWSIGLEMLASMIDRLESELAL